MLADQIRQIKEEREKKTETEIAELKAKIAVLKQQSSSVPDSHNYNEEETRRYLIDVLLKEAGWNIHQPEWTEYEVTGMPNTTNNLFNDAIPNELRKPLTSPELQALQQQALKDYLTFASQTTKSKSKLSKTDEHLEALNTAIANL